MSALNTRPNPYSERLTFAYAKSSVETRMKDPSAGLNPFRNSRLVNSDLSESSCVNLTSFQANFERDYPEEYALSLQFDYDCDMSDEEKKLISREEFERMRYHPINNPSGTMFVKRDSPPTFDPHSWMD